MVKKSYYFICLLVLLLPGGELRAQECRRIVSLAASVSNNLYLLGVQDRIVGRTQYCLPGEKDGIPVVADAVNVNVEKVVSLKPDVVIASPLTHPRVISALQKMGIRTVYLKQPASFSDICAQLETLGGICGKAEAARRYVRECRERLAKVHKTAAGKKVFMQQGANPLFGVLPGSFMNDYITLLGGKNICEDVTGGVISRELVLLRNPDVIVIVTMGDMGTAEIAEWRKYSTLAAVRNDRIFSIDADKTCSATPLTFIEVLEELSGKISAR